MGNVNRGDVAGFGTLGMAQGDGMTAPSGTYLREREGFGWDIGIICIHPYHSSNLNIPSHLPIIECHCDEVYEPPPHPEMFRCGEHIMGIQGHPEYTMDILAHLVDCLLQRQLIQSRHAEAAKVRLKAGREPDREAWKSLCTSFLKEK